MDLDQEVTFFCYLVAKLFQYRVSSDLDLSFTRLPLKLGCPVSWWLVVQVPGYLAAGNQMWWMGSQPGNS